MATDTLVSVERYLSTSYSPDCDYVDGVVLERNMGGRSHSVVQRLFIRFLDNRRTQFGISVFPEQRVQVKRTRFRIPDVCVYVGPGPQEEVFTRPPHICIEILSPDDRMSEMQEKIDDYLAFGVRYVWVVDPAARRAWTYTAAGSQQARDGVLRTEGPEITVPLAEIFAEL